ncbi:MAG TPA: hypothetical protein VMU06_03620 [Stellaceae bacterium]|nr:hypothetical protein [Stellaceae bacterium]
MGYDVTLHLVDEKQIREVLVPKLLGKIEAQTPFDDKEPEAAKLWQQVRDLLATGAPERTAKGICELAVMFSACTLPYRYERDFGLSLWTDGWEEGSEVPEYPDELYSDPDPLFAEVLTARPDLRGNFPGVIDGETATGVYVPHEKVKAVRIWIEGAVRKLSKGEKRRVKGLLQLLSAAEERGLAVWEACDLAVPMLDRAPGDPSLMWADFLGTGPQGSGEEGIDIPRECDDIAGAGRHTLFLYRAQLYVTVIADLRTWPPRFIEREGEYTVDAAEIPETGAWLLRPSRKTGAADPLPPAPCLLPLADAETRLFALPQDPEVAARDFDRLGVVGERMVMFGRDWNLGAGQQMDLAIRERGGAFALARHLPAAATELDEVQRTRRVTYAYGTVRTRDGRSYLIWNGDGYALSPGRAEKVFALSALDPTTRGWTFAPHGEGGFYYISKRQLFLAPGPGQAPVALLPKLRNIIQVAEGPNDWVIVHQGGNPSEFIAEIYLPSSEQLIRLDPDELGIDDPVDFVTFAPETKRFVMMTHYGRMHAVTLDRVEAMPRYNAKTGRRAK